MRRSVTSLKLTVFPYLRSMMCFDFFWRVTVFGGILYLTYHFIIKTKDMVEHVEYSGDDGQTVFSHTLGYEKELD